MPHAAPTHKQKHQTPRTTPVRKHRTRERRDPASQSLVHSFAWRKFSIAYRRANPLCAYCLVDGKVKASQEVDHIIPHKGDPEIFWMDDNYQALCSDCHKTKTREEARPQDLPKYVQCNPPWALVISGEQATGKTTEARRVQQEQGGIIYDLDDIAEQNGLPYRDRTWEQAKRALYYRNYALRSHPSDRGLILIQSNVTASQRATLIKRLGAEFRHMTATYQQLAARLSERATEAH